MDRIVVSSQEIAEVGDLATNAAPLQPKLAPAIHWSLKAAVSILVLFLPLLCLVTIILRVSFRNQSPRIRYAWTAFLATLLTISGFLTSGAAVLVFSLVPLPVIVSSSLDDLDQRQQFPSLPSSAPMNSVAISQDLKSLVVVVAPAQRNWLNHQQMPVMYYGAGLLLQADQEGYLFATARHVVDGGRTDGNAGHALVATASGIWADAKVIARHQHLDLVLLWMPRREGHALFTQSVAKADDGEPIFVIGHPEGLRFTLSSGIVSRLEGDIVQISAPVSPGNSGGPVYDARGNLVGIVSAKMDHSADPNAENLNFAISAQSLGEATGWNFAENGRASFERFLNASRTASARQKL